MAGQIEARQPPTVSIRPEWPDDAAAIREVTTAAFTLGDHGYGGEARIVDGLRTGGALALSLVAIENGRIVGHVAFSPVTIIGGPEGWFGLGPVSIRPDRQGAAIGLALIRAGLAQLEKDGAGGCVVLGEPGFYTRFGFTADPALIYRVSPPNIP